MASFADKLKEKIAKFQTQEKERETTKGSINTDPTKFPIFKQGDVVTMRLLPPKPVLEDKDVDFYKTFYFHSYRTAKNKEKWNFFVCPKNLSWDHPCHFCDYVADVYQSFGSNADYKNYKRKKSFVYNAYLISYKNEKMSDDSTHVKEWEKCIGQVRVIYFPYTVKNIISDELTDTGSSIFDPYEGYDLIIKVVSKTEKGNTYSDYSLTKFGKDKYPIMKVKKDIDKLLENTFDISAVIETRVIAEAEMVKKAKMEGVIITEVSLDSVNEQTHEMEEDIPIGEPDPVEEEAEPEKPIKEPLEESEPEESEEPVEEESKPKEDDSEDVDDIINKLNSMFE